MHKIEEHLEIIELHQTEEGGILASISYEPYRKVWLRDHSHVALTLYKFGRLENAKRATAFIKKVMEREREKLRKILQIPRNDEDFYNLENHPRARYYPDLSYVEEPWFERQYDGVALSLILLLEATKYGFEVDRELLIDIGNYLYYVWGTPCADVWESFEEYIHLETLGAIYGALKLLMETVGYQREKELDNLRIAIGSFIENYPHKMKKSLDEKPIGLDSSVLFLFTHFGTLRDKSLLRRFLMALYEKLSPDGIGLRRYEIEEIKEFDTYFGGGVWCILTYLAGIAHTILNDRKKALNILDYCPFPIPEQIVRDDIIFSKEWRSWWQEREGGGPAEVLAWSHAIYLDFIYTIKLTSKT